MEKQKGAGRPTELTDELFGKIKQSILDGNDLRETAKICEINEDTLYQWHSKNYSNIADKIEGWRRDRKLNLAEGVIEEMLIMPVTVLKHYDDDKDGTEYIATEPALVRIKQDTAKFVAETLGKDNYSKRNEMTGKNGADLIPKPILSNALSVHNGNQQNSQSDQENQGGARGDISE